MKSILETMPGMAARELSDDDVAMIVGGRLTNLGRSQSEMIEYSRSLCARARSEQDSYQADKIYRYVSDSFLGSDNACLVKLKTARTCAQSLSDPNLRSEALEKINGWIDVLNR